MENDINTGEKSDWKKYIRSVFDMYDGKATSDEIANLFSKLDPSDQQKVNDFAKRIIRKSIEDKSININNIVVHGGIYHADDVFAVGAIKMLYPDANILRTNNPEIIKKHQSTKNSVVLDIGKIYDLMRGCLDHHQYGKGKDAVRSSEGIAFSSIGLVWDVVGEKIIKKVLSSDFICQKILHKLKETYNISNDEFKNESVLIKIKNIVYKKLIAYLDANDTGELEISTNIKGLEPYSIKSIINQSHWPLEDFDTDFLSKVDGIAKEVLLGAIRDGLSSVSFGLAKNEIFKNNLPQKYSDGKLSVFKTRMKGIVEFCYDDPSVEFYMHPSDKGGFMISAVPGEMGIRGQYRFPGGIPDLNDSSKKDFHVQHLVAGWMVVVETEEDGKKLVSEIYKKSNNLSNQNI